MSDSFIGDSTDPQERTAEVIKWHKNQSNIGIIIWCHVIVFHHGKPLICKRK